MKLCDAISRYVTYKQGIGMVFETEATILRAFMERVGPNVPIAKINSDSALQYLNGHGPVTLFWHRKHDALTGLWRFAIQHGWTDRSPLPARRPKSRSLSSLTSTREMSSNDCLMEPQRINESGASWNQSLCGPSSY